MSVRNVVKSIQDIMRQDVGVDGDAQRISQLCWMFFLKIIDDQDQELELMQLYLSSPIRGALRPELKWTHYRDENLWPNAVIQIRVENRLSASRFECIQINQ